MKRHNWKQENSTQSFASVTKLQLRRGRSKQKMETLFKCIQKYCYMYLHTFENETLDLACTGKTGIIVKCEMHAYFHRKTGTQNLVAWTHRRGPFARHTKTLSSALQASITIDRRIHAILRNNLMLMKENWLWVWRMAFILRDCTQLIDGDEIAFV